MMEIRTSILVQNIKKKRKNGWYLKDLGWSEHLFDLCLVDKLQATRIYFQIKQSLNMY